MRKIVIGGLSGLSFSLLAAGMLLPHHFAAQAADTPPSVAAPVAEPVAMPHAPDSFANLVDNLLPAVVNISSTQKAVEPEDVPEMPQFPPGSPFQDFFDQFMEQHGGNQPTLPPASLGSGFVIDAEKGLIVTNNHVVKDADEVRVTFHDDSTVPAEIVGRDDKVDIAVLRVKTTKKLTAVQFGDSDKMRVGDWIVAIGNPFGLGGTVTAGIVSAQQRDISAGPYDDFIQTDASINRGNSGGPMFNLKGEVIGINTAIFSPSGGSVGIGFAVPANLCKPVIDQILQFGHTRRGWLGVRIQSVTEDIAESLGLKESKGALIATVTATGPAEKAGLKAGDIITYFDGKEVNAMRTLPRVVAETAIGKAVDVTYWRDGKELKTQVKVGELEVAEKEGLVDSETDATDEDTKATPENAIKVKSVGMALSALRPQDREQYQIDKDLEGVLVASVEPNSEALVKGLQQGDVIVEINQQAVTDPNVAADIIAKAVTAQRKSVLLLVQRQSDVTFVALRLDSKHDKDTAKEKPDAGKDGKKTAPKADPKVAPKAAPGEDTPADEEDEQDAAPAPEQTP